jgi:DNA-binding CsgD family transcriptional regulator
MLSRSETIVAYLAIESLRNEEVPANLDRSVGTIKNQLSSAYRKLGVRNRVELARRLPALRQVTTITPPRKSSRTRLRSADLMA